MRGDSALFCAAIFHPRTAFRLMRINAGELSHALLRTAEIRQFLDVLHQL